MEAKIEITGCARRRIHVPLHWLDNWNTSEKAEAADMGREGRELLAGVLSRPPERSVGAKATRAQINDSGSASGQLMHNMETCPSTFPTAIQRGNRRCLLTAMLRELWKFIMSIKVICGFSSAQEVNWNRSDVPNYNCHHHHIHQDLPYPHTSPIAIVC